MELEYNVSMLQTDNMNTVRVCVWRPVSEERIKVYVPVADGKDVRWTWLEVDSASAPPATFNIPVTFEKRGVMQKLADQLFEQYGVKPTTALNEDAVDSLKDHLEDLRKIVFNYDFVRLERGAPLIEEK